jgi:hypothetical protein
MSIVRSGLLGGSLLLLWVLTPLALGAEPGSEREEYVERAEPICKTNVLANRRIFVGAKGEVKRGELKTASSHFFRAATAFGKTIRRIDAIPKPLADEAKLAKWIDLLDDEKSLIEKIGRALAADDKHKAHSYSVELNRNSNKANNAVLLFGFDYCRIDPSRFG